MTADRATRMKEARKLTKLLQTLNELNMPVIGKVHGGAFGGGVGLACVCDYVLADESTKFGLTETRLGLIPATIGPYVVSQRHGKTGVHVGAGFLVPPITGAIVDDTISRLADTWETDETSEGIEAFFERLLL